MDSKTTPYNNNRYCAYRELFKIKHVYNAPYALGKGRNNDDIHLYQIDNSKHHSLNKQDNIIYSNTNENNNNNVWMHLSTIQNQLITWCDIAVILYSQKEHLLWFIFDHSDEYHFEVMGYSIEEKQSLLKIIIYF